MIYGGTRNMEELHMLHVTCTYDKEWCFSRHFLFTAYNVLCRSLTGEVEKEKK